MSDERGNHDLLGASSWACRSGFVGSEPRHSGTAAGVHGMPAYLVGVQLFFRLRNQVLNELELALAQSNGQIQISKLRPTFL